MKALVYRGPNQMRWEEWPEPQPGPGEAVVAVRAVGICGSDLHGYTGESGRRTPPLVMGHEATGEIIRVGPQVSTGGVGGRVVVQPIVTCGDCDQCRTGHANRCRNRRFLGGSLGGAMAERLVAPLRNLLPLPERVSSVEGTLVEPLAVGLHAVRQAGDLAGRSVLIAGSGPIGLCTLVAARWAGAHVVVVTDVMSQRREAALAMGAEAALDPGAGDWQQDLVPLVGAREVDVAFDAVGITPTFEQALGAVRLGGTVVAIGGWRAVPLDLSYLVTHEVHLVGTFNYTPAEFDEARLWVQDGHFDTRPLAVDVRPMAEGAAVFENLVRNPGGAIKTVLVPPEANP